MKIEKDDSNDKKSLLQQTTPAVPQVQRVKHPTLAIAVYRLLVPADSAADRIVNRFIKSGHENKQDADMPNTVVPPFPGYTDAEQITQEKNSDTSQAMNQSSSKLPTRLVVALLLLVAAAVAGFLASHSPF